MSEQSAPVEAAPEPAPRKKPYFPPVVEDLGGLAEITLQISGGGEF